MMRKVIGVILILFGVAILMDEELDTLEKGKEMNELAKREPAELVVTEDQMEVVKTTIAPDATPSELKLYFYDCQRQGVHPLDRLIHFTKHKATDGTKRYTPISSIDLFRARADATGLYAGNDDPVFRNADQGLPVEATVTVWKVIGATKCAFTATARWAEYYPGEKKGFMWRKMPHLMLGKTAEALALRKAFPRQLHGLYIHEEMQQAVKMDEEYNENKVISIDQVREQSRKLKDGKIFKWWEITDTTGQLYITQDEILIGPIEQAHSQGKQINITWKKNRLGKLELTEAIPVVDAGSKDDLGYDGEIPNE